MQKKSPHDPEWRHLALDPAKDLPLCRAPRHSEESGLDVARGTDLFAHRAPSGVLYFYLYHWSAFQNETDICQITSTEAAADFFLKHVTRRIERKKQQ